MVGIVQNNLTGLVSLLAAESTIICGLASSVGDLSSELSGLQSHLRPARIRDRVVRSLLVVLLVACDLAGAGLDGGVGVDGLTAELEALELVGDLGEAGVVGLRGKTLATGV